MKKGLLLSMAASAVVFAGGDIAPVQPVQPAPAACDFWGSIGFRYDFNDVEVNGIGITGFGDEETNAFTATVVLGVEKDLGYGFGFGAEVAGSFVTDGAFNKFPGVDRENAEISQLYLTYKAGNTAIKAGRMELPKAVSPWAWSDRTLNRIDTAFNGITVVNTDIQDTTLVAAWIRSASNNNNTVQIGDKGVFMLGAINTSITNTTVSLAAYYVPDFDVNVDAKSVWGSVVTKIDNVEVGLQVAYADVDYIGWDATVGVAGYVAANYNGFDAKLTAAYINDGDAPLNMGGTSGFWGNVGYSTINGALGSALGGDTVGEKQTIGKLDVGYKLPNDYGRIYAGAAYVKYDDVALDKAVAGRVGYSFNLKGVNAKIEYRYSKVDDVAGNSVKAQKIRLEGVYKF